MSVIVRSLLVRGALASADKAFTNKLSMVWVRCKSRDVELPSNKGSQAGKFRRIVHYPEEYTVKPLQVTNLAGRDPVSGRLVIKGIGGGIKHKYHWIQWVRDGPTEGPPLVEKVLEVIDDGCRTSKVALVASGDSMKYILATENMKAGDLIRVSKCIPRNPVIPNEGDTYPLGALPLGTTVCSIEKYAGTGSWYCHAAGTYATVSRKMGDKVVITLPSKQEVALAKECLAMVGRISNILHDKTPIGSAQRNRELGNRPRSGLWHRKDGRHGRKVRALPPVQEFQHEGQKEPPKVLRLTIDTDLRYTLKI